MYVTFIIHTCEYQFYCRAAHKLLALIYYTFELEYLSCSKRIKLVQRAVHTILHAANFHGSHVYT